MPNFTVRKQFDGSGGGAKNPTIPTKKRPGLTPGIPSVRTISCAGAEAASETPMIGPTLTPAALASFCACARASEIRSDVEHCCGDPCVPRTLNVMLRPAFFCAIICCSAVRDAVVSLTFDNGAESVKVHSSSRGGKMPALGARPGDGAYTLERLALVIPDPASAATTASRLASRPELKSTSNKTWSG